MAKRKKRPSVKREAVASPVVLVTRKIGDFTRLLLAVRAGGRCQFDGCNKYLFEHHLTLTAANFAQMAHIVAFSECGPRGRFELRPEYINSVENLMFLCHPCHKEIDDHPDRYEVATLREYKRKHEERIRHVTSLGPDLKTSVIQLKSRVNGQTVAIPIAEVTRAVAPRYPTDAHGHVIDLTGLGDEGPEFIQAATRTIRQRVQRLYESGMDIEDTRHVSLFALAPIPLLIYLGSQLSNKVPVDVYQRHRDTEDWVWKTTGEAVRYGARRRRQGSDRSKVALLLSLSGTIDLGSLPPAIDKQFSIYELTLDGRDPVPTFLRTREDLEGFKDAYHGLLAGIQRDHGQFEEMHFFPAVPAPVAVLCGRELLPKVRPALVVYDNDKRSGGFIQILKVNNHDHS